jgi:hypothetical protein
LAEINIKTIIHHKDSFYAECRAFGRLKEARREELAVNCYGYIITNSRHEEDGFRQFGVGEWDRREEDEGRSVRGIVMEFIHSEERFESDRVTKMMRNLEGLNAREFKCVM